ncbi:MAG: type II secretion system F family protein [Planctomycetota bacterium]|nr:type II secretion system F family protein [Planctomycetota bacterium]
MFEFAGNDLSQVLPFAVFGGVVFGTWMVFDLVWPHGSKTEDRLERLNANRSTVLEEQAVSLGGLLEKASPALARPLEPQTEKEANRMRQKLSLAGFRGENAITIYLGFKMASALVGLFLGGIVLWVQGDYQGLKIIQCLGLGGLFLFLPDFCLGILSVSRQKKIFLELPDALDLLVVCVESGLGLDQAMRKVTQEMNETHPVICSEFEICNRQLQMGRERDEVLNELGRRTGVADLKALASILIQADRFGSSVAQALRVQSESMRTKRRQLAEEKAAKTAVKLIFPLVLFIFPGIFVVLVGPAAIIMINEMLPALQQ